MKKSPPNNGACRITKPDPGQGKIIKLELDSDDKSVDKVAFTAALTDAQKESRKKKPLVVNVSPDFIRVWNDFAFYLDTFP